MSIGRGGGIPAMTFGNSFLGLGRKGGFHRRAYAAGNKPRGNGEKKKKKKGLAGGVPREESCKICKKGGPRHDPRGTIDLGPVRLAC